MIAGLIMLWEREGGLRKFDHSERGGFSLETLQGHPRLLGLLRNGGNHLEVTGKMRVPET